MRPLRVCQIITNTYVGGAESMLQKLVTRLDRREFDVKVISLLECGLTGRNIRSAGIPVTALEIAEGGRLHPFRAKQLLSELRDFQPDVVQTWMYHADLAGGLAARMFGNAPVVWNIRHSSLDPRIDKLRTRLIARTCAGLSRWVPRKIIVNSEAGRDVHARLGYSAEKLVVIPNCFDTEQFRPDMDAKLSVRQELGLPPTAQLIGIVGRFHPMKGHEIFVRAMHNVLAAFPDAHCVICGRDATAEQPQLASWIAATGLQSRFHVLGQRTDMPRLQAAFDIAVSASVSGEGFSNVVGEAMACGVPCVVTNVGDSASIVGDTGIVVAPWDAVALAAGCVRVLAMNASDRGSLGHAARHRVETHYGLDSIVDRYVEVWDEVAGSTRRKLDSDLVALKAA